MIIKRIEGATRVLGESQGYLGLPVRDQVGVYLIGGKEESCHEMVTAWEPTPDEVERIKAGATIYLSVLGLQHPPVNITVGEVPT